MYSARGLSRSLTAKLPFFEALNVADLFLPFPGVPVPPLGVVVAASSSPTTSGSTTSDALARRRLALWLENEGTPTPPRGEREEAHIGRRPRKFLWLSLPSDTASTLPRSPNRRD